MASCAAIPALRGALEHPGAVSWPDLHITLPSISQMFKIFFLSFFCCCFRTISRNTLASGVTITAPSVSHLYLFFSPSIWALVVTSNLVSQEPGARSRE
ncbi:hypothetical protein BS50DRAFT_407690 [Corynespora cassiicola Philippines]|uniref:Uncharacterized protein n=1 Tax=Corynespora cassiicola Philippines TaxID=1448308 RepID=A0A2T2NLJ2_CORCC|nr:hypothetical protein BS50DRAFT_407690 [Corynespora cassiicola Philippines]